MGLDSLVRRRDQAAGEIDGAEAFEETGAFSSHTCKMQS
jgi:hypothetical protein